MKLSNLLAIGGGLIGLAAGGDTASQIASGAAIVSGVAGATGHSNIAKIAGITSLGAGAYSLFSGGDTSTAATDGQGKDSLNTALSDNAASATPSFGGSGGPSGTGQSFSDAGYAAKSGMDNGDSVATVSPSTTAASAPVTMAAPALAAPQPVQTTTPSLLQQAQSGLSGVGSFIDKNKELVKLGAGALEGAFGPEAEKTSLLKQQLALQQNELNRKIANSNNLVGLNLGVAPNPLAAVRRTGV